ncbi:hypothetical protein FJT64_025761 [Amphibalanus amphitrite]|uniref:Uncharacterized protein n=1 Tax=Amphibalanus amphitrite TaxID=1232801 RepID=A0A6A4WH70_AMPAM|nr:hypothetical protein FJT64_025761 [Amphibalanus amphitrite]
MPDTGAEATVMGADMAASLGVATKMTGSVGGEIKFSSAGSTPLTCIGQFSATVTFGDCQTATTVYVLREVTGFLLGWCDSVRLRILPANFPAQIPVNIWRSQSVPDQSRGSHVRSQSISSRPLQRPDRPPAPPVDEHLAPPTGHPLQHVAAARAAGGTGTSAGGTEAPAGDTGAAVGGTGAAAGGAGTTAGGAGTTAGGAGAAGSSTKPSSQQTAASAQPVWEHEYDPSDDVIRGHEAALRQQFKDVFDGNETLCEMAGGPMVIDLTDDAVPTALTAARNIPYCWREEIKSQLDDLVARGIVAPDIFPRVFDTTGHLREMTGGPMRIELKDDARPTAVTAARSIPFAYRDQAKRELGTEATMHRCVEL